MKAEIKFDDGKIVELSQETTDKLRAELVKNDEQLKVGTFRALKSPTSGGLRLAMMETERDKWDGEWHCLTNAKAAEFYYPFEIRKIIEGLKRLIGD